jgi:hypothetical protein
VALEWGICDAGVVHSKWSSDRNCLDCLNQKSHFVSDIGMIPIFMGHVMYKITNPLLVDFSDTQRLSRIPFDQIQNSMDSLLKYLSSGTGPMLIRSM